ncbi:MAG: recombination-associated protein RdgC [Syntrophales bacterium]|jgi:recombination associated protein RdgC|nr:recombination-associated protein RdgC [Syntrophales bacterium]MCK9390757.1 recombination-associated protein RdgC [Syntrophales bacterium]
MGLKKGAFSFSRFSVSNPLPGNFAELFDEKIKSFAFRDFFPENEEKSLGWTGLQEILDREFAYAAHTLGDFRVFSLRIDRKTTPSALLRLRFLEAERGMLAERETKKLYKEEREALREAIRQEMMKQAHPVPSMLDVCWSLAKRMIYFSSHAEKVLQDFQDFFGETFEMAIALHVPWLDALAQGEDNVAEFLSRQPGREFLTWLWFKSEERNGRIAMEGREEVGLVFVRRLILESGEGDYAESVVCQGQHALMLEGKEALRQGKKIREARLSLEIDSMEWEFTFKADLFQFQSMKLPAPSEEFDEKSALEEEGRLLERIFLVERAIETMDQLFAFFMRLRLSEGWPAEAARMEIWMNRQEKDEG